MHKISLMPKYKILVQAFKEGGVLIRVQRELFAHFKTLGGVRSGNFKMIFWEELLKAFHAVPVVKIIYATRYITFTLRKSALRLL